MKKYSIYYRKNTDDSSSDDSNLHYICKNVDYDLAKECFLEFIYMNFRSDVLDCVILLEHSPLLVENLDILYDLNHCNLPNFDYSIKLYCSF